MFIGPIDGPDLLHTTDRQFALDAPWKLAGRLAFARRDLLLADRISLRAKLLSLRLASRGEPGLPATSL